MSFTCDIYLSDGVLFLTYACVDAVGEYVREQNKTKNALSLWIFYSNMRKGSRKERKIK